MRYLWVVLATFVAMAVCGSLKLPPSVCLAAGVGVPLAVWRWGPR